MYQAIRFQIIKMHASYHMMLQWNRCNSKFLVLKCLF